MLKYFVMIIIAALLFPAAALAQETFEGVVKVTVTNSRGEKNDVTVYTRENALRVESEEGEEVKHGNILVKSDSIYIMMPTEEKYIQMPINTNNKIQNFADDADNLKKAGETKEILGYQAEKWIFNDNGADVEIWSTKELGNVVNLLNFIPDAASEVWYKNIFSEGFFPLSVTVTNSARNTVNKFEVTEIEEKELDDSDFDLPDGFTRMQTNR